MLGGEGQKLVAPGVRSVASKPSQSGFPFSASRKAMATPSLQMLVECRRHPPTHTQCHIAGASHALFPLPRMPFLSSAGKLPHLWLKAAPRGPVLCLCCSVPGSVPRTAPSTQPSAVNTGVNEGNMNEQKCPPLPSSSCPCLAGGPQQPVHVPSLRSLASLEPSPGKEECSKTTSSRRTEWMLTTRGSGEQRSWQ